MLTLAIAITAFVIGKTQAVELETMPFIDHLKNLNKTMCNVMVKCKPDAKVEECIIQFNKITEANPNNAKVTVKKAVSEQCIEEAKTATCENVMTKVTQGNCALSALQMSN